MRILNSILGLSVVISSIFGCSRVALERNGLAVDGSDIKSSDQLDDKRVIDEVLPQLPACEGVNSDTYACLLIMDSFERSTITNGPDDGFGWSSLIDDAGNLNGHKVAANIYNDTELGATPEAITGPATDEGRSIMYTGRPGSSVHSIFLVSKPIDLSSFNSVLVSYDYLPIDLESWSYRGNQGNERILLEVCEADLAACGAGSPLSKDGLNSNNWGVRAQSEIGAGTGLNGDNHDLTHWRKGSVNIDISGMSEAQKANFVFRITVTLDEGFINDDISGGLEDGIALDNVIAMASKVTVVDDEPQDPELPPNKDDRVYQ